MRPADPKLRSLRLRLRVSVIALGCILGQASALVERVLVQHAVCQEHGESVHLRGVAVAGDLSATAANEPTVVASSSASADQHEHCVLAGCRSLTAQQQQISSVHCELIFARGRDPDGLCAGPIRTLYLVAPKTSPPGIA
jgi:hypothetical protein